MDGIETKDEVQMKNENGGSGGGGGEPGKVGEMKLILFY